MTEEKHEGCPTVECLDERLRELARTSADLDTIFLKMIDGLEARVHALEKRNGELQ